MRLLTNTAAFVRVATIAGGLVLLSAACGDDSAGPSPAPDNGSESSDPPDAGDNADPADRSDELLGLWQIDTFQLAGALGEAEIVGPDAATIEFRDNGTMSVSTGCNTGEGDWEARGVYRSPADDEDAIFAGQAISFGSISRTSEACDADIADQDLAVPGAIRAADSFTLEDGTLTLWRDGNLMISGTRP